jgi:hypothetical protein
VTGWVIANVVALAVASTAIAYRIYFRLIADIGPSRALTVTFLIPLFGVLWGFLFLGEAIGPNMLVGGVLIVAGTALALKNGAAAAVVPAKAPRWRWKTRRSSSNRCTGASARRGGSPSARRNSCANSSASSPVRSPRSPSSTTRTAG